MGGQLPQAEIEAIFHQKVGRAISAFGRIETMLCNHFALITQMQPFIAKAVFFSARSLRGRLDMIDSTLAAAVSFNEFPDLVPFLKIASKRTGQWASVRNMLAHAGMAHVDWPESKFHGQHILYDSSSNDWPNPKGVITQDQLDAASENFSILSGILLMAYIPPNAPNAKVLKEGLSLIQLLPIRAHERQSSQTFLKRLAQVLPAGSYPFQI